MPRSAARVVLLAGGAAAVACRLPEPPAARLEMLEKGATQSVYAADGHLERVLRDANGDRRADAQLLYRPDGSLQAAEMDTDLDGVVDRWEAFRTDGSLESVGLSRSTPGRPDVWERYAGSPQAVRRDFDDDGDGRAERSEVIEGGRVVRDELDTDADGRIDRRLDRDAQGRIVAIEVERDGAWERRPVHRP
jgi:hypothetical protein